MDNETVTTVREHRYDGAVTARLEITIPAVFSSEAAGEYYTEAARRFAEWFAESVAPRSEAVYDASSDPRKKWRFEPVRVLLRCAGEPDGALICVLREAEIVCNRTRRVSRRKELWNAESGKMIPAFRFRRSGGPFKMKI